MEYRDFKCLISEIRKLKYKCNVRENNFLTSIERYDFISDKQMTWLRQIYQKAAGGSVYERRKII